MAGPWEKYAETGPWSKYAAPEVADTRNRAEETRSGILRGAAGIGNVILSPMRATVNKIAGTYGVGQGAADFLNEMNAAPEAQDKIDGGSNFYKGGRLAAEVGMTLPVGGAVAQLGKAALPASVQAAPWVANALEAIGTSGMRAGSATGPANMLTRAAGGAVAGGVTAGMVNPDDAAGGAAIGAALPGALKVAGAVGNKVGSVIRGPAQPADLTAAIDTARQAGYVIPPTQAKPSLLNRTLEGFSGKITTAQNASAKNQGVTNRMAAEALGLPGDTRLTPDVLTGIRQQAGQAFESLRNTGMVQADQTYDQALNAIVAKYKGAAGGFPGLAKPEVESLITTLRQPLFPSDAAVDAVRVLREKADAAYGAGDKGLGKAIKDAATALEDQLERHVSKGAQTNSGVLTKGTRPPEKGMVRLYRGESPTTGFHDVFEADKLQNFARPPGMVGKRYTDELKVANYYKNSYGRDAVLKYIDVPLNELDKYRVGTAEFIVDPSMVRLPASNNILEEFRDARKLIAKTYTVEKALNKETGTVSAQRLAAELNKGKPLSGELETAARFAARFPKASQAVEGMGSLPQSSPLDWALGGSLAATTANPPLALASVMARPAARSLALSPLVQNRLAQQPSSPNALTRLLSSPEAVQLGYRAAPVTLGAR